MYFRTDDNGRCLLYRGKAWFRGWMVGIAGSMAGGMATYQTCADLLEYLPRQQDSSQNADSPILGFQR